MIKNKLRIKNIIFYNKQRKTGVGFKISSKNTVLYDDLASFKSGIVVDINKELSSIVNTTPRENKHFLEIFKNLNVDLVEIHYEEIREYWLGFLKETLQDKKIYINIAYSRDFLEKLQTKDK